MYNERKGGGKSSISSMSTSCELDIHNAHFYTHAHIHTPTYTQTLPNSYNKLYGSSELKKVYFSNL